MGSDFLLEIYDLSWPRHRGIDSHEHQEAGPGLFTMMWF